MNLISINTFRARMCQPAQRRIRENQKARMVVVVQPEDIKNSGVRNFVSKLEGPITKSLLYTIEEIAVDICGEDLSEARRRFDQVWDFVLSHLPVHENTVNETVKQRLARIKPGNPRPRTEADAEHFFLALKCLKLGDWHYKNAEGYLVKYIDRNIDYLRDCLAWRAYWGQDHSYNDTSRWIEEWLQKEVEEDREVNIQAQGCGQQPAGCLQRVFDEK